jgi:hypothetical protein
MASSLVRYTSSIERKRGLEGSSKQTKQTSVMGAMAKSGISQLVMIRKIFFTRRVALKERLAFWLVSLGEALRSMLRCLFANDLVFAAIVAIPASALVAAAIPKRGTEPVTASLFAKETRAASIATNRAVHATVERVRRIFLERFCDPARHTTTRPSAKSTTSEMIPTIGIQVRSVTVRASFTVSLSAAPRGSEMKEF